MYSAQLGWEGKIKTYLHKQKIQRKIKIITLAQLGQAEKKKTKVITKHIALSSPGLGGKNVKLKKLHSSLPGLGGKTKQHKTETLFT